jgi:hypothetical protein
MSSGTTEPPRNHKAEITSNFQGSAVNQKVPVTRGFLSEWPLFQGFLSGSEFQERREILDPIIGNGEVDSSILSGSTTFSDPRLFRDNIQRDTEFSAKRRSDPVVRTYPYPLILAAQIPALQEAAPVASFLWRLTADPPGAESIALPHRPGNQVAKSALPTVPFLARR